MQCIIIHYRSLFFLPRKGFDTEVVNEAHGLLTELLFNKETLPNDTHQKLRRIKDILAPRIERMLSHTPVHVGKIGSQNFYYVANVYSSSVILHFCGVGQRTSENKNIFVARIGMLPIDDPRLL